MTTKKKDTKEKKGFLSSVDFISGAAGGITQVLVGQPFDLIKVRQQMNTNNKQSITVLVKDIIKNEGILAFYKGTLSPLLGISFAVAFQFTGFEFGRRVLSKYKQKAYEELSKLDIMCAGAIGGVCYSIIISPMELFRIKMQVQNESSKVKYRSSLDAGVKIYKNHGIKGIYSGYTACFHREVWGNMFYFGVYEILMQLSQKKHNGQRSSIPIYEILLYGSFAGLALWSSTYPFDIIKSKIQASEYGDKRYSTLRNTFNSIVVESGYSGLYRGIGPCLSRAVVANACIFMSYEKTKQYLISKNL